MHIRGEPIISTGLQPGVASRNRDRAASAALPLLNKPLKRLSLLIAPFTGLKSGANGEPT